jgi:precorrin-2 dehydrogenase / sirohydrochlorin ferrochelatase
VLPIVLDHSKMTVGLAGEGDAQDARRRMLEAAGVTPVSVPLDAVSGLAGLKLLYIAGGDDAVCAALARRAKGLGILVNVEDVPELCDFHVPATLRRGDLLLTVSSGGRSPGLVRIVREWLAGQFGVEWKDRVEQVGRSRDDWRARGFSSADVSTKTREFVAERAWLP